MGPCWPSSPWQECWPRIAAKFYKAVIQAVHLNSSALAQLEGFHVPAAYRMAKKHRPKRGPNGVWVYPKMVDVLEECGMRSIANYIQVRCQTIAQYVVTRPILTACVGGERRRGSMSRQWWWEEPMCLDAEDAIGSDASDGHSVASTATDA